MASSFPAFQRWIRSLGKNYRERAATLSDLTNTPVSPRTVSDLASGRLPRQLLSILTPDALAALLKDLAEDRNHQ